MRSFIGASLALAATSALAHSPSTRKSLSFGPERSHARFITDVPRTNWFAPPSSPKDVARQHISSIFPGRTLVEGRDFVFRDDSYTDDSTSVTHLYVRQVVNGIEVADGDISLNIYNNQVISYGDSFFRGAIPGELTNTQVPEDRHLEYCEVQHSLVHDASVDDFTTSAGQIVLGGKQTASQAAPHPNCNTLQTVFEAREASLRSSTGQNVADPREAALHFMIAAHPNPDAAVVIQNDFNGHLGEMYSTMESSFTGTLSQQVETIHNVPGAVNPVKAKLVYVQSPGEAASALTLAWKLEAEMVDNWYEVYMDATHPSHIHTVVDWASDAPASKTVAPIPPKTKEATYNVWAWGINDPSEGKRSIVSGEYDKLASPLGWHSIPAANDPSLKSHNKKPNEIVDFTTTWGNNVFAHENWEGANNWKDNYRPTAEDLQFVYKYGPKGKDGESVAPKDYANLSITQMFYTSNMFHDLLYRYGFDEKSGNFQQHNFGKGGKEGDAVIANAQDGSGYNNANFATPPDGQNGRCRMYIWNTATPYRDGDLEAGIVIHELAHGLSTRLTGGPANSGCLGWGESGGMGEGWGDFIASTVRSSANYSDYPMGAWAANQPGGIRNYPYSTNTTVNPSTYKILDGGRYWGVHAIGEVWAEILWVVEQKLIAKHGFTTTLFPPAALEDGTVPLGDFYKEGSDATSPLIPKHGNSLLLKLVVDGMKLQPCRPSFFNARDAIIQADKLLTGGENACELWSGFSDRGMGPSASIIGSTPWGGGVRTDDFEVPKGVCA